MTPKESFTNKGIDPPDSKSSQQSRDAAQKILLKEYGGLLRTVEPVRLTNRVVLIAMMLFQVAYWRFSLSREIYFIVIVALASTFWFLQEFSIFRRLADLGELIAATDAEMSAIGKEEYTRPITLPPPRKPAAEPIVSSSRVESDRIWTNAYINWRHHVWKERSYGFIQRAEPVIWFVLTFAFGLVSILLGLR